MTRRLSPLDLATLGYALVALAATATRTPGSLPHRGLIAGAHLLVVALALLAPHARRAGAVGRFLGEFYPLAIVFSLYSTVGLVNLAGGRSFDALVQGWEAALFGTQPALAWIRAQPWPWLSGLLHAAYLSYYVILAGAPLGLWASGRGQAARRTLALVMGTFYLCYTLFLLFPVAGPRYLFPLPENDATRTAIARLAHGLVAAGSAWGTAFPSSHVAVALVASVCALRASARLGAPLLLASILLALGTVYGQFHYAVDALAGAAVAGLVLATAGRALRS